MKTEFEQKQSIAEVFKTGGDNPGLSTALHTFILSHQVWPRFRTAPASTSLIWQATIRPGHGKREANF